MILTFLFLATLAACVLRRMWRQRRIDRWMLTYLAEMPRRRLPSPRDDVHLILCIADHFEPRLGQVSDDVALTRVRSWLSKYPQLFGEFADSDGRPPQHTFFFPLEEYRSEHLDLLAELCHSGFGEVEVHLHHDRDNARNLELRLRTFTEALADRHALLSHHRQTGELAYGFIHGNWALANSRDDGRWCGVNEELVVLRRTGCYADFTMPSAPAPAQTRKINSIYYPGGDRQHAAAHDWGIDLGRGPVRDDLVLIQGPLLLDWQRRKWGLVPRIENGCIQHNQPPTFDRLRLWLTARIQVPARPDWFFVKLHTHGAREANQAVLLGEPMVRFHQSLADHARRNPNFHYHYVTAREMYNLVRAAESGWQGSVAAARDRELIFNGSCSRSMSLVAAYGMV